jgi:ADP-heptose:LPS heptosyltransferase
LPAGPTYVGFAPGAGDRGKCWPLKRYVVLAREQLPKGRRPVFILGPGESKWFTFLREAVPQAIIPGWRDGSLDPAVARPTQVAALGARLSAAVANDSGTAHMLAAGETPLVSLFGYTNRREVPAGDATLLPPRGAQLRQRRRGRDSVRRRCGGAGEHA